jgi:hypothetical protein
VELKPVESIVAPRRFLLANLEHANLWSAQLQNANFNGAKLAHASLGGANLGDAFLGNADLRKAENLEPAQIKTSFSWRDGHYSPEMREVLGLPLEMS